MMTHFQANVAGGESIIPPEDRIIANLLLMQIQQGRNEHYGQRVNDARLCRELAKLSRQVERTLEAAQAARGGDLLLTDMGRAALESEGGE